MNVCKVRRLSWGKFQVDNRESYPLLLWRFFLSLEIDEN
jgi:hypothetical protein